MRTQWRAEEWREVDQPPVFLAAFSPGDEVLILDGEFTTMPDTFGGGPLAAAPFALELSSALCSSAGGVTLDLDLVSRAGMRTDGLSALLAASTAAGSTQPVGEQHWVVSLPCDSTFPNWVGLLIGSNLDYQFDFGGTRLVERDAGVIVLAGTPDAVSDAESMVHAAATATGTELKPIGWDIDQY
jgi:hypothetical protein